MADKRGGSAEFDTASAGERQRRTQRRTAAPEPALPQPFQGYAAIARECTARPHTGDGSHAAARQSGSSRPPRSGPPVNPDVTLPLREPTPSYPAGGSGQSPPLGPRAPPQPRPSRWTGLPLPDSASREEPLGARPLGAEPSGAGPPRTGPSGTGPPRTRPSGTGLSGSRPLGAASSGVGRSAVCTPGSAGCGMRLGIETEFLIAAIKQPDSLREDSSEFVKDLAKKHNSDVSPSHPRMLEHLRAPNEKADFTRWAMTLDETVTRRSWKSLGLEMVTPILNASAGSRWRDDVQATWRYLRKHYQITADSTCSTHVHVSLVSGYTTDQLKRIASSVIHFETAFEALVPETRRANSQVKSNWLHSGSLAQQGLSRSKSIAVIENARSTPEVVGLMQLRGQQGFAWNFRSLYFKRTIEFRKPPASVTADEALSWAELAMTFIQAAILHGSSAELSTYPAHVTGLSSFLKNVCVAGVNEPGRWYKLWNLKPVNAALEPVPNLLIHNKEVAARLNSLLSADKRLIEQQGGQFTNRGIPVANP